MSFRTRGLIAGEESTFVFACHSERSEESAFSGLLMNHNYATYILASRSRNLYTGVTGDLQNRMLEHRQGLVSGFTTRYRVFRLVHFESFGHIQDAIAREKEIKGWRREKKIRLIENDNPTWEDLSAHLPHNYSPEMKKQIPHTARQNRERVRDDTPKTDTPKTETPRADVQETNAPRTSTRETDAQETNTQETDTQKTETPKTDARETNGHQR